MKRGYKKGVPMGGTLPKRVKNRSPRFIAAAWKDDGPAEIEFFYPFQDGPEYLDGEKNRVYAVANPSPGGCVYLLASTFISSVVLYIGRPCILILDRS